VSLFRVHLAKESDPELFNIHPCTITITITITTTTTTMVKDRYDLHIHKNLFAVVPLPQLIPALRDKLKINRQILVIQNPLMGF